MLYRFIFFLLFLSSFTPAIILSFTKTKKALVIAPVTDLISDPLTTYKNKPFFTYETLPLESKKGTNNCKRIHQAIFNETVEIIESTNQEVKIKILNSFYHDTYNNKHATYWARKKDFIPYEQLKKNNLDLSLIPPPISYSSSTGVPKKNIVTLKYPFYSKQVRRTFSAGTRFVATKHQPLEKYIHVYALTQETKETEKTLTLKKILLPKKLCISHTKIKNNIQKRKQFLQLLKEWANLQIGFIPYVWGGCSFTNACKKNNIIAIDTQSNLAKHNKKQNKKEKPIYLRPDFCTNPIPGLDCSGLVLRAAQICHIPYYYKNTSTIQKNLKKITKIKDLHEGDLLVYTGHVIVISDKKKNKIIEARTNEFGCGKVQEICLNQAFENIETFQDLFHLKKKCHTLQRINKNKKVVQTITNFDFFTLFRKS